MRHVILTCKNHPNLRWSCKEIAWTPGYGYNGSRHIFFLGYVVPNYGESGGVIGYTVVEECDCPANCLELTSEKS